MMKPPTQHIAESAIVLRGPLRSIHVPPMAADSPNMTIAMLKTMEIGVSSVPNRVTSGSLNTLKA